MTHGHPPSQQSSDSALSTDVPAAQPGAPARRWLQHAFWVAFLVRLAYITLAHTYRFRAFPDHFEFGWEMARIARSLVTGHGYADPFSGHTGPTAWVGPLYPLLIAAVFRVAGVYTLLSAWVLLALNAVFSALVVYPMAAIARRCFPPRVARWSVWLWALYPAAMQYAVRWVWETTLSTLLFTCAVALAIRIRQEPSREPAEIVRDWAVFGLLWGAMALSNPALVVFLPFAGLWALRLRANRLAAGVTGPLVAGIMFCAILSPWIVRNAQVFGHFVPLRANFGAELCLGNGPGATGLLMEYHHPAKDPQQLRLYAALGEYRYARVRGALARRTIAANPGLFLRNTLKRVDFFWFGVPAPDGARASSFFRSLNFGFLSTAGLLGLLLAVRRGICGAWLLAGAFATLPAVYYLVTVHARFRHPLEPLIALLTVYLFQSAQRRPTAA